MQSPMQNAGTNQPAYKVSISARLMAAFAYLIPAIGGALSSFYLMSVLRAMRAAESAGRSAVLLALAESTVPMLVSLYLGIVLGFIVIIALIARAAMQTETASPPGWFFVLCGFFFLVPAGLFLEAESMIIEVLIAPVSSMGISEVASNLSLLLISSAASAILICIGLLLMSVLPFSKRTKPKWSPLIAAAFVEFLMIAAVVAFQWRYLWLNEAGMYE